MNKISMKPTGKIYLTFKSRNYKIYKALAEYIDNSTQSYFDNKHNFNKPLEIFINYNKNKIEILDNANGMNISDLNEALKLGGKVKRNSGRNQFGMGMKVASIWFTDNWRITTKKYSEDKGYIINIKMSDLIKDIDPIPREFNAKKSDHYTKIELLKLSNRKVAGKAAKKLKEVLSTVYKRDIESGNVNIFINNEKITTKDFEYYTHEDEGKLKKKINFEFMFDQKKFIVKGFIGIRTKGSTSETSGGFALYDNDRVIIPNWRDSDIFKQTNSYTYQRLVGELDLIGFDVTSDKEEFDWHNGLKEAFIERLKEYTDPYSKFAESIRTRLEPDSKIEVEKIKKIGKLISKPKDVKINYLDEPIKKNNFKIESQYHFKKIIRINDKKFSIKIELVKGGDFITINRDKSKINVLINRDHKFLVPKMSNPEELQNYINAFMYQGVSMFYTQEMYPLKHGRSTYLKTDTFWRIFNELLLSEGEENEK